MTARERLNKTVTTGATTRRIPILTYHSLDDSHTPVSVAPARFARQMEALHRSGWRTVSLDELLAGLPRGVWPARSFMLTFDDGYANFCEQALPVLLPLGFTAIVFVVAAWVGRSNAWPGQAAWAPRLPLMDWETLRLIANKGMLLGAHTLNHVHLPSLSPGDAEREIAGSGRLIEERTGRQTLMFAYPYGDATPALQALAGRYYRAGFGTRLAFCTPTSRALQLERIDMFYLQGKPAALAESRRWLASYLALRQVLRQVRGGLVSLTNDRPFGDRAVVR